MTSVGRRERPARVLGTTSMLHQYCDLCHRKEKGSDAVVGHSLVLRSRTFVLCATLLRRCDQLIT